MLYTATGLIIAIGYIPQTLKLLRTKSTCHDISILTWVIWDYTTIISLLYSMFELNDPKLIAVNAVHTFFITLIIAITLYKRYKYAPHTPNLHQNGELQ